MSPLGLAAPLPLPNPGAKLCTMCGPMPEAEPHTPSTQPSQALTTGPLMGTSVATEDLLFDRDGERLAEEVDITQEPTGSGLQLSDLALPPDLFPPSGERASTTRQLALRIQYWQDLAQSLEERAQERQNEAVEALIAARNASQSHDRQQQQVQHGRRMHAFFGSESPEFAHYLQASDEAIDLTNLASQCRIRAAREYVLGSDELHSDRQGVDEENVGSEGNDTREASADD